MPLFCSSSLAGRRSLLLAGLVGALALGACESTPQRPDASAALPWASAQDSQAYRLTAAQHLYARYATRIYQGKLPVALYAVGVLETDIGPTGQVQALRWKRAPSHAPHVSQEIEALVRAAAPFPPPPHGTVVRSSEVWLWDASGRFQLDSLTEGQLQQASETEPTEPTEPSDVPLTRPAPPAAGQW